jgi:hypothetical protein
VNSIRDRGASDDNASSSLKGDQSVLGRNEWGVLRKRWATTPTSLVSQSRDDLGSRTVCIEDSVNEIDDDQFKLPDRGWNTMIELRTLAASPQRSRTRIEVGGLEEFGSVDELWVRPRRPWFIQSPIF